MGIIYSAWQYVIDYFHKQGVQPNLKAAKIKISSQRLCHTLRLKQIKLQDKTKSLETQLVKMVQPSNNSPSPVITRNIELQRAIMQEIVINSELLAGYQEIIRCSGVIRSQADTMERDIGLISYDCQLAILTIIFAKNALNLEEMISVVDFIPEQIQTTITIKDISEPLREYVENTRAASPSAMNQYALEMCYRNYIEFDKFNEIGHNFNYNPSNYKKDRRTKSSQMFAVSLEQIQIPIEFEQQPVYQEDGHQADYKEKDEPMLAKYQRNYCWGDQTQKIMVDSQNKQNKEQQKIV